MSRRAQSRLGLYYLVLRGAEGRMFLANEDYPSFIRIVDGLLAETRYRLHAFCLLPTQAHLAVQMLDLPPMDFAQRLAIKYGRWLQQRYDRAAHPPELAAPIRLVDQDVKSRELIRFIHLLPLRLRQDPAEYIWSGHRTYLGKARVVCLETRTGLHLFDTNLKLARTKYEEYFNAGLAAARLPRSQRPRADTGGADPRASIASVHELVERIAQLGGRTVEDIRSTSRERLVSLLRAIVTWHAIRLEVATFGEITRYLRRHPSTLHVAMTRYMKLYPALFVRPGDLEALAAVAAEKINGRIPDADPHTGHDTGA